jgi:hypothetical protein
MPKYNRFIQLENGQLTNDPQNPLFNEYSANFFYFEQGSLAENLNEKDVVDVIMLPNRQLKAVLPDGRVLLYG